MAKKKAQVRFEERLKVYGDQLSRWLFGDIIHWDRRNAVKNNVEQGLKHFKLDHFKDSGLRFKIVTWLEPNNATAFYYLGRSYLALGKRAWAAKALQKSLSLKASDETVYMLAIAAGDKIPAAKLPKSMPLTLSLEHFDKIADDFTKEQLEIYDYRGHTLLGAAIKSVLPAGRVNYRVLDLGAGTGLVGPLLRDISRETIGVDLSQKMLDLANGVVDDKARKAYDVLAKAELHAYLREAAFASFDIVVAANVAGYIGDLKVLFEQVSRTLAPGGVFAFTADILPGEGYRLDTSAGRFRFSKSYLERLAAEAHLSAAKFEEAEIYPAYKMWLCVLRKQG